MKLYQTVHNHFYDPCNTMFILIISIYTTKNNSFKLCLELIEKFYFNIKFVSYRVKLPENSHSLTKLLSFDEESVEVSNFRTF